MLEYGLKDLNKINLNIKKGDIIFLYGDLASGKTTFSKHIINNLLKVKDDIVSPTYTYYNKYKENIYHFDLYRLNNYEEFYSIGGEDILNNENNISLIEWPEIISKYFKPSISIYFKNGKNDNCRIIDIIKN